MDSALGSLGSDLAFSVSFGIGQELMASADEAGVEQSELFASIIVLSIAIGLLGRLSRLVLRQSAPEDSGAREDHVSSGMYAFATVLLDIGRRVALSTSVQLLAGSIRTHRTSRLHRILQLLGVAVFFLFLEGSSMITPPRAKRL